MTAAGYATGIRQLPLLAADALAAAAQRTERISLGTAVLPVGYEDPIRLAKDTATVDLLSDGRLELGVAGGNANFSSFFGLDDGRLWKEAAHERVRRTVAAIEGTAIGTSEKGVEYSVPPHSHSLRDRLWYGPGNIGTATRTGQEGLDLLLSAIAPDIGLPFDEAQLAQIHAVREAWTRTDREPGCRRRGCSSRRSTIASASSTRITRICVPTRALPPHGLRAH
jgi:alkanesulfonate monooxygenase SsuD/methylene tetrahydromethanopterin reductase-like flavin-dependent oxidoreductase (luciferase family)